MFNVSFRHPKEPFFILQLFLVLLAENKIKNQSLNSDEIQSPTNITIDKVKANDI